MWVPPWLIDRIRWSEPGVCIWSVDNNREFVIFVALAGYHGPSLIMIFCYIKVFLVMYKSASLFKPKVTPASEATTITVAEASRSSDNTQDGRSAAQKEKKVAKPEPKASKPKTDQSQSKERKIFISLSYIIIAYLICWSPFHIVFDVLFFNPNAVSFTWYSFASLCCYINSCLNPILYAASNNDFRQAFKNILLCRYCKK